MAERGAYEAACQVIHDRVVTEGFATLHQTNRMDLTIEGFILRPEWRNLFERETQRLAHERLAEFGYEA